MMKCKLFEVCYHRIHRHVIWFIVHGFLLAKCVTRMSSCTCQVKLTRQGYLLHKALWEIIVANLSCRWVKENFETTAKLSVIMKNWLNHWLFQVNWLSFSHHEKMMRNLLFFTSNIIYLKQKVVKYEINFHTVKDGTEDKF